MQIIEYPNEFHVKIDFNRFRQRNVAAVKSIPGAYFDGKQKVWRISIAQRHNVVKLYNYCKAQYFKLDASPEQISEIPPLPNLDSNVSLKEGSMREYQKQGVARGLQLKRFLNGDEQGLGKTLQSIATLYEAAKREEEVFPCLVICPASTKINWAREWEKWVGKKSMILSDNVKNTYHRYYEMGMYDIFIVNYESLKKYFVKYMPPKGKMHNSLDIILDERAGLFKSVIVDESHRVKDTKTQQAKFVLRIAHGKNYAILLSGTPVVNKPIDLFSQLAIMGQLKHFGGAKGFKDRYCEGGNGASNLKELNYKLNTRCYFRREKKEVAKDLPPKDRQVVYCDITTREQYDKAQNDFVRFLVEKGCDDKEIARKLRGEILAKIVELKKISAYGKLNDVKEFINEVLDSGNKLIVFLIHRFILDELLKEYPQAVTVTGKENGAQKQRSIDSFQNNPQTKLIICNIDAAGVGINLTASSRVVFIELPWNYAKMVQAEDRSHRIGQPLPVTCTAFLGHKTIDQKIYNMILEKSKMANAITGGTDNMESQIVDNIMDLFKH
jgi:SWI/SNF-related matrix-associated actin-dependent regulator 1 of chromatin subfamily A